MSRLTVIAGTVLFAWSLVTWMVGSGRNRPLSFRLTVIPVALGVLLIAAGILGWAVAA